MAKYSTATLLDLKGEALLKVYEAYILGSAATKPWLAGGVLKEDVEDEILTRMEFDFYAV